MQLGWRGEEVVRRWLEQRGYVFVERNFRTRYGEIDLVMRDGDVTVFVEVKTRQSLAFGPAVESMSLMKIKRLHTTIEQYCQRHPDVVTYRLDVVIVDANFKPVAHLDTITE